MNSASTSMQAPLRIGAVLAQLRSDFPDITISKIRFLEAEGLLAPQRSASGYRKFSPADVDRLRYVLAAQRDCYLPLKVIKEQLDAADGRVSDLPPLPVASDPAVSEPVGNEPEPINMAEQQLRSGIHSGQSTGLSRVELCAKSGLAESDIRQLEQFGLLPKIPRDGYYDNNAVVIAETVARLAVFGIEPRHLRTFQSAAEREVALLEQVVAPLQRQRSISGRERTAEVAGELAALATCLHTALVRMVLHKTLLLAN